MMKHQQPGLMRFQGFTLDLMEQKTPKHILNFNACFYILL